MLIIIIIVYEINYNNYNFCYKNIIYNNIIFFQFALYVNLYTIHTYNLYQIFKNKPYAHNILIFLISLCFTICTIINHNFMYLKKYNLLKIDYKDVYDFSLL